VQRSTRTRLTAMVREATRRVCQLGFGTYPVGAAGMRRGVRTRLRELSRAPQYTTGARGRLSSRSGTLCPHNRSPRTCPPGGVPTHRREGMSVVPFVRAAKAPPAESSARSIPMAVAKSGSCVSFRPRGLRRHTMHSTYCHIIRTVCQPRGVGSHEIIGNFTVSFIERVPRPNQRQRIPGYVHRRANGDDRRVVVSCQPMGKSAADVAGQLGCRCVSLL